MCIVLDVLVTLCIDTAGFYCVYRREVGGLYLFCLLGEVWVELTGVFTVADIHTMQF